MSQVLIHRKGEERKDHKYTKREWVKGKWRYWYEDVKDKLGFDEKEAVEKKKTEYDKAVSKQDDDHNKWLDQKVRRKYDKLNKEVRDKEIELAKTYTQSARATKKTEAELKELTEQYLKTPIGAIENVMNRGKKFVEDVFGITDKKEMEAYKEERAEKKQKDTERAELEKREQKKAKEREGNERKEKYNKLEAERLVQEERQATEVLDDFGDLAKKSGYVHSDVKDQKAVNPYYYTGEYEYTNNCAYCTAAYDLRQRGYDVEAAAKDESIGNTLEKIAGWYKGAEIVSYKSLVKTYGDGGPITPEKSAEYLEKDLLKHGDGARGHLCVVWNSGGAHDIVWEVENGEVIIRDCQTGRTTTDLVDYTSRCSDFDYFRSDNLDLDESILETVRNKKDVVSKSTSVKRGGGTRRR